MAKPRISIITPTFNQGHFIEETIDSVLSQNYDNLDYLIIDGGSTDNTIEIIKKYEKYLSFWISEKDHGQSDAINKGMAKASGEIVNWLNSDDYYEPGTLHRVADHFHDPAINVVCGKSNIIDEQNNFLCQSTGTDIYSSLAKTIGWARIDQPETFFRKSAVDRMGPLEEKFHFVMDREWWIRYLLIFGMENILQVDEIYANFRRHNDSKTVSQKSKFNMESASIYYFLANAINHKRIASTIEEVEEINPELKVNADLTGRDQLLFDAINYFLLRQADHYYSIDERAKLNKYLSMISTDSLAPSDAALLEKLKFRTKFLPKFIKNLRP